MSKLEKEFDEIGKVDDSNNDNLDEVGEGGDDVMFLGGVLFSLSIFR